ncbi:hypothetical protein F4775DRAFT_324007 [Biscogniauxia sp. FL1348]|nr:hypothetical protein F4775DRAFT_324007 [Biscogniauxia sp. FL1348]
MGEKGRESEAGLTWLLAVVAKALSGGADLGIVANVATLVACTARKRRHGDKSVCLCSWIISKIFHKSLVVSHSEVFDSLSAAVWWHRCISLI